MAITRLDMQEFGVFTDLQLNFASGINVIIGANGTGKTHLMKLLYSLHACLDQKLPTAELRGKLERVFRPDHIGRLVHRRVGVHSAKVSAHIDGGTFSFSLNTLGNMRPSVRSVAVRGRALFIPSREALSIYEGFVSLYNNREIAFDETYYDLCLALGAPTLRGPRGQRAASLIAPIEKALGGKVVLNGDRFYVKRGDGEFEAHLVSEGLRKIATLARLILNGSLVEKGVLFWDEPEANLNPVLARILIEFLRQLARRGVQIFLATHDTLVAQRLSLPNEYHVESATPTRFIGLYRDSEGDVRADFGDVLADLGHNPILEEFTRFSDDERTAFEASLKSGVGA